MSARLARLERFAFEAEETFDEIPDGEPRMQLTNVRRVVVERPARLAADTEGDTLARAAWYDGRTATVLDKAHNSYGQVEVPATIDAALDDLAERYGIEVPLVDFLYTDPYAVLTEGVRHGRYLGLHRAAGVLCHHLAFVQDTIEWQIWIDAGEKPLPRKFVITYVREPGEPQYAAVFRRWSLDPEFPEGLFSFRAPPGAEEVEFSRFARGSKAWGRVVQAEAGTGLGGQPILELELTDIDVGGRVVAVATETQSYTAGGRSPAKKIVGGAALGAGIGALIDGGEGAAWGAGVGAAAGTAAAAGSSGNQVAVGAGTALEFHLTHPVSVDVLTQVAKAQ